MSFLDTSLTNASPGTATPPPQAVGQSPPTLNEEVTEVIGQLGRFWGGFRKQSQSAIEAARKDLGEYVSQAQKGLNEQLATLSVNSPTPTAERDITTAPTSSSRDLVDATTADGESSAPSSASASTATLPDPQQEQQRQPEQHPNAQTLFTRLQSSLPPDLLTTLRDTLPDSVRDAQRRQELAQAAQARVHGAAARGEVLLRGASVFLRDAVRVVPPESAAPASASTPPAFEDAVTPRAEAPPPVAISVTPATRRDALLRALRATPAILRVDPAKEERSATLFVTWAQVEDLRDETQREVELAADDGALQITRSMLGQLSFPLVDSGLAECVDKDPRNTVPEELSEDEFWTRYSFRVYQINQEDERRKAVLEGPTAQEEDFSWEDEEEDVLPRREPVLGVGHGVGQLTAAVTSGSTSPERSDDSFDLVSSGHTSATGHASANHPHMKEASSDGDSDEEREEEDDDDDDGGDEDSAESDWE
ncbi:hypothetical protein EDB85DRAFT_2142619 [Lactarius pseudohatsudake]|nr:hypothetical protein EDB85DRAFT_2142619 [Lactarius pseudohatsudake]